MKVLHCIHSLVSGGAEKQLKLIVSHSKAYGLDASIFCVNPKGSEEYPDNVKIYKSTKNTKYNIRLFHDLHKAIIEDRPHVIHVWLPASLSIPALFISWLNKKPAIFSYRSAMRFRRPLSIVEYFIVLLSVNTIVSNNDVKQSSYFYRKLYKVKNGKIIPNIIDIPRQYYKNERNSGTELKILYVGRLVPSKNINCLLQALARLEMHDQWSLRICGTGVDEKKLKTKVCEYQLDHKVHFMGYANNIYPIMQRSDILVLPSWYEGMPNALLEALQIGLPSVVSNIDAHTRILGGAKGAITFNPDKPEELAHHLRGILKGTIKLDKYQIAGARLAAHYTPQIILKKLSATYQETSSDHHKRLC